MSDLSKPLYLRCVDRGTGETLYTPCGKDYLRGKGHGFDDERHLWPAFHWLISECRPECISEIRYGAGESRPAGRIEFANGCGISWVAHTPSNRQQCGGESTSAEKGWEQESIGGWQLSERLEGCTVPDFQRPSLQGFKGNEPSEVNSFWRNADWLYCRDEKWRPVEPGTFPLERPKPL